MEGVAQFGEGVIGLRVHEGSQPILLARERLLLVLPTGNLYEYLCQQCGTSTGSKTEQERHGILP